MSRYTPPKEICRSRSIHEHRKVSHKMTTKIRIDGGSWTPMCSWCGKKEQ